MLPKSVIEDAEVWFVVGGNKEISTSQGDDTRMFQASRECQCLTHCWGVITFCIVRKRFCLLMDIDCHVNLQPSGLTAFQLFF